MPSFGEKLRKEREKRKITLEDISSSTKIGTRMLQALEDEKFNQLPGGIFNKGFVRAYARVVGLDEDQTVADYLQASGDAPPVKPEVETRETARDNPRENTRKNPPREREPETSNHLETRVEATSRQLPWGIFAVVLLIVAVALSLWSRRRHEEEQLAHAPSASESATSPGTTPSSSKTSMQTSPVNAPVTTTAPASTAPNQKPATSPAPASATPQAAPGEFTVVIHAQEDSWLSVTSDGKSAGSEMLVAGTERAVPARKQVVVKAGNIGGLEVRLNGKKLDVGGDFGEVKTVTIGANGLVPNAAPTPPTQ